MLANFDVANAIKLKLGHYSILSSIMQNSAIFIFFPQTGN